MAFPRQVDAFSARCSLGARMSWAYDSSTTPTVASLYTTTHQATRRSPSVYAELDSNGDAIDQNSYYAKFMLQLQLRKDWDIIDEGRMEDLLGIECVSNPDDSITLHQNKYIISMIKRFFTPDEREKLKKASTPYTTNLAQLVIEALEGSTASEPAYPDLVKDYQRKVGSLMYCYTATRPDLAYGAGAGH